MRTATTTILFCLLLTAVEVTVGAEIVRITTGEWPPYMSENLKHGGLSNHVISEAFKLEGYSVEFAFFPWKRAFEAAKSGDKYHATSYWYRSPEREKLFIYSEPLQIDKNVFFYRKDNPLEHWETLDDLKGKRIGAVAGFTYTKEFWDAQKSGKLQIETASSEELNIRKLWKGRIDIFPTGPLVGQMIIRELFGPEALERAAFHPKPLLAVTGHLLISKKTEHANELVEAFNRGLAKLKENGRYAQFREDLIAGKYNL